MVAVQRLSAVDSSGRDLVESRPEKDPDPARAALQSVSANVRTRSLRLGLGAPTASAASVFTSIQATIRTYTGVSKVPLEDNAQWTPVQLGDLRAEYRLRTVGTLHYVSFRPASAGEHVYRVEPRWTSSGLPTSPSLKDSGELSYLIDRELMATKGLSVTIITGVSVKDVEAAGVCVPLPQ